MSMWFTNISDDKAKPDARLSVGRDLTQETVQRDVNGLLCRSWMEPHECTVADVASKAGDCRGKVFDEIVDVRDKAEAAQAWAKEAEVKLMAERKAGAMLTEKEKNKGGQGTGNKRVTGSLQISASTRCSRPADKNTPACRTIDSPNSFGIATKTTGRSCRRGISSWPEWLTCRRTRRKPSGTRCLSTSKQPGTVWAALIGSCEQRYHTANRQDDPLLHDRRRRTVSRLERTRLAKSSIRKNPRRVIHRENCQTYPMATNHQLQKPP